MDEKGFESKLQRLLKQDFSEGTFAFREALLARCFELLESDDIATNNVPDAIELGDDELDMLAAAGDIEAQLADRANGNRRFTI